ncbi:MAG: signal transduction histidine kinase [Rickettsiales bacterium]|jgi:signal transduction histidine kinase
MLLIPNSKKPQNKDYFVFSIIVTFVMIVVATIFIFYSILEYKNNSYKILENEATTIDNVIGSSFAYSNRINSYIGNKIVRNGAEDLSFILDLFHEVDKMSLFREMNNGASILSWTSFDWVDKNNLQVVNSGLGIRKNPPNISSRSYASASKDNPWKSQISFPMIGNLSQTWVIPFGTGIADDEDNFLGIVVVGFNVSELENKIQQKLTDRSVFVVLDENYNIILQSSPNEFDHKSDYYKKANLQERFPESSGLLSKKISTPKNKYFYYQKMVDYPYIILSGYNENYLYEKFINLILPDLIEFFVITIFFLLILYLFKTRILTLLSNEKSLKNKLKQSSQAKTDLLRNISHDLRNYISGISGLANIMQYDKSEDVLKKDTTDQLKIKLTQDKEFSQLICDSADEMLGYVRDLLDIDQAESGIIRLDTFEECDIEDLINKILFLNKEFVESHKINIITSIEDDLKTVKCDKRRLRSVFDNLITNAVKYSPRDSKVHIYAKNTVKSGGKYIYVEIFDSGIGMDKKEIEKALSGKGLDITKSNLKKPSDCHGVGMPLVKKIVDAMGAKMEINSSKGKGTSVKIWITQNNDQ